MREFIRQRETGRANRAKRLAPLLILIAAAASSTTLYQTRLRAGQDPAGKDVNAPPASSNPSAGVVTAGHPDTSHGNFKVRVEVVDVPVSVLDKRGMPVIDLDQNDFRVYEDGKPQTIRYFSRDTRPPLRVGLILDTSNSARPELKFEEDAAGEFVYTVLQGLNSGNQVFLQTFDATSSIIQDFTNDPDTLNEKIRDLKAGGGKAVYDAIYYACKQKMLGAGPPEATRRVLVLISDGLDVQSQHTLDEAMSMAHRAETAIYTIGNAAYGFTNPGDKYLEEIADKTGGQAFFPLRESAGTDLATGYLSHGQIDSMETNKGLGAETGIYTAQRMIKLADSLDSIERELENQYTIGYAPSDSQLDGTYRTIKVSVRKRDVSLRYKPGYFATAEK